MPHQYHH
ncbi:hypothetical protein D018_2930A, partial [Vibrio parahaemolyticus VP2007-007]